MARMPQCRDQSSHSAWGRLAVPPLQEGLAGFVRGRWGVAPLRMCLRLSFLLKGHAQAQKGLRRSVQGVGELGEWPLQEVL